MCKHRIVCTALDITEHEIKKKIYITTKNSNSFSQLIMHVEIANTQHESAVIRYQLRGKRTVSAERRCQMSPLPSAEGSRVVLALNGRCTEHHLVTCVDPDLADLFSGLE